MGLGSDGAAKPKGERNSPPLKGSNSDRDWIRRAFEPGGGTLSPGRAFGRRSYTSLTIQGKLAGWPA